MHKIVAVQCALDKDYHNATPITKSSQLNTDINIHDIVLKLQILMNALSVITTVIRIPNVLTRMVATIVAALKALKAMERLAKENLIQCPPQSQGQGILEGCGLGEACNYIKAFGPAKFPHKENSIPKIYWGNIP